MALRLNPLEPRMGGALKRPEIEHAQLIQTAKKKFEMGFSNSFLDQGSLSSTGKRREGHNEAPLQSLSTNHRAPLPARSASVLGIHSSERDVDGSLRSKGDEVMDYMDLECILQEKMKELNAHKISGAPIHNHKSKGGDPPSKGDSVSSKRGDRGSGDGGGPGMDDDGYNPLEYAQRCKEAAFLFRLCQQEIRLQVSIHCPERARLADKTLEFYTTVLDCLVGPIDKCRLALSHMQQERDTEAAWKTSLVQSLTDWTKEKSSNVLASRGWARSGLARTPDHHTRNNVDEGIAGGNSGGGHKNSVGGEGSVVRDRDGVVVNGAGKWENQEKRFRDCVESMWAKLQAAAECVYMLQLDNERLERDLADVNAARASEVGCAEDAERHALSEARASKEALAQSESRCKELSDQCSGLRGSVETLQGDLLKTQQLVQKLSQDLAASEENAKELAKRLADTKDELGVLQAKLSEYTREGVVLTPRPKWGEITLQQPIVPEQLVDGKDGRKGVMQLSGSTCECVAVMHRHMKKSAERIAELSGELEKEKQESGSARQHAEKEAQRADEEKTARQSLAADLEKIKSVEKASAASQMPDLGDAFGVSVSEYLQFYLSKRFGLQGVMSAWEVERMGKDFGWVMTANVKALTTLE